jgi:penicillin-binding protein 1A
VVGYFWRLIWGVTWRVGAVVALILGTTTWYFHSQLPELDALLDARARGSVTMLDYEDQVFAWRGESFGVIRADQVSKHLHNAIVATEDRRFYSHLGVSPRGIASAIRINLREGRGPFSGNGGSTLTQQVAKLLCLGVPYDAAQWKSEAEYEADCRRGSLTRKLKEVPYALALEAKYSKGDILTIYLNRAYLGASARGFEAASQRYFGVSAREVRPAQAAMLAGLLIAPSRLAPTASLSRAQGRAAVVVGLMEEQGYLTKAAAAEARANPATLTEAAAQRTGGWFADWIMDSTPSFLTRGTTEDVIIHTTFDQHMQAEVEAAISHVFATKVREGSNAQAAVIVMSADGAVRAMAGGRAPAAPGAFNRATQAKRQTGSAFKPFVYAAALDLGYGPNHILDDSPLTINQRGQAPWSPQNYTRDFKGRVTMTEALKHSLNIPVVRLSEEIGRDVVRKVAEDFGIVSDLAQGPALALGVSETSLLEMTGAYAGILNGGSSVTPYGVSELRLKSDREPLIRQLGGINERVISESAARQLTWMMAQIIEGGTGTRAKLGEREAAGKTGTTQAARDAWFLGFTADYVTGVWMGYDDNSPLTGVTGGGLPAEIWRETMARIHRGLPARPLPMDAPVAQVAQPQAGDDGWIVGPGGVWIQVQPQRQQPPPQDPIGSMVDQLMRDVIGTLGGQW